MGNTAHRFAVATVHGRFQPFHRGHLTYLLLARRQCTHLVIGITNPDTLHLAPHPADPTRHLAMSNPFTYFERLQMIRSSLSELRISEKTFTIVPFPLDVPEILQQYCPKSPILLRNRGPWSVAKEAILRSHGWEVIYIEDERDLSISATRIRSKIAVGDAWEADLPNACAQFLKTLDVQHRLITLSAQRR
jgi:cytidyltransferase-like protein